MNGKKWTDNDVAILLTMIDTGETHARIAKRLKRKPAAVTAKLHQLRKKKINAYNEAIQKKIDDVWEIQAEPDPVEVVKSEHKKFDLETNLFVAGTVLIIGGLFAMGVLFL